MTSQRPRLSHEINLDGARTGIAQIVIHPGYSTECGLPRSQQQDHLHLILLSICIHAYGFAQWEEWDEKRIETESGVMKGSLNKEDKER